MHRQTSPAMRRQRSCSDATQNTNTSTNTNTNRLRSRGNASLSLSQSCELARMSARQSSGSDQSTISLALSTSSCRAAESPWVSVDVPAEGERRFGLHQGGSSLEYQLLTVIIKRGGSIYSVEIGEEGHLYTGSGSKFVRVWAFPRASEVGRLPSGSAGVTAIVVNDDFVFTAHGDHKIRLWRRSRNRHRRIATLPTRRHSMYMCMRPRYGGATSSSAEPPRHGGVISALACSENLLYSASLDSTVKVWRLSDLKCTETIRAHQAAVNDLVVGSDALLFTGSEDGTVRVWRRNLGRAPHTMIVTLRTATTVKAVAVDGRRLYAGCSDGSLTWWEKEPFSSTCRFMEGGVMTGHSDSVLCLSAARGLLFSGSVDATIRVWHAGSCLAVVTGHGGAVQCLSGATFLSSDDDVHAGEDGGDVAEQRWSCTLASGGDDGAVSVWRFWFTDPV